MKPLSDSRADDNIPLMNQRSEDGGRAEAREYGKLEMCNEREYQNRVERRTYIYVPESCNLAVHTYIPSEMQSVIYSPTILWHVPRAQIPLRPCT